jgi:hypothetical protein
MLTLWAEGEFDAVAWRGCVETSDGRRHYFYTWAGLEKILRAWHVLLEQ